MAVTRAGSSITMTATADASTSTVFLVGINFQGTGLTAGQRLQITDTGGSVIADYMTEAATDNADLLAGRPAQFQQGLKITAGTLAGTWVVSFILG
jgi:hypothetical protein